jgi:hypothetical protein
MRTLHSGKNGMNVKIPQKRFVDDYDFGNASMSVTGLLIEEILATITLLFYHMFLRGINASVIDPTYAGNVLFHANTVNCVHSLSL